MNLNTNIINSLVFEIEGLIHVVNKHQENTPQSILDTLKDKASLLNTEVQALQLPAVVEKPAATQQEKPEVSHQETPADTLQAPTPPPFVPHNDINNGDVDIIDVVDDLSHGDTPVQPNQPPMIPSVAANDFAAPTLASNDIRVDEKLGREQAKDLRNAISLNDRFRFRRELFGNSDSELNNAFTMVETMKSFNQAEDYFYDYLGLDPQNPDVKDFMDIIQRHFA